MKAEELSRLYWARFENLSGSIIFRDGTVSDNRWQGEILLAQKADGKGGYQFGAVSRVALRSLPLEPLGGTLSLAGPLDPTTAEQYGDQVSMPFAMRGYYPKLALLEPACVESDAVYPQFEYFEGEFTLELKDEIGDEAYIFSIQLNQDVIPKDDYSSPLISLSLDPVEIHFYPLPDEYSLGEKHFSLSYCSGGPPAGSGHVHKRLNLRFISLLNPQPAESDLESWLQDPFAGASLEGACEVWWQNGGILINPKSTIDFASFSNGDITHLEENQLPANVPQDPDRIDVYLVNKLLDQPGGGITYGCGTDQAYIILELEKARNNRYLLAHEIGHVLGLHHPGGPVLCSEFWEGSYCSVMVPGNPNSSRNTQHNLEVIEIPSYPLTPPVLEPLGNGGWKQNLPEDLPPGIFHRIRDFPYDDGTEPSVPASPFTSWWTHSDVWNSPKGPKPGANLDRQYEDYASMIHADHSPVADDPSTGGTNWMYVQLTTCQDLVDPVDVYLYLAVPGMSSQPLIPLNGSNGPHLQFRAVPPPSTLPTPGVPRVQGIAWNVPGNIDPHFCVFAVATSASDPPPAALTAVINNPQAHNFFHLANLLKLDNDVAQRNLNIQYSTGGSTSSMLAWVEMSLDPEEIDTAEIEVDASHAQALSGLTLEVNAEEWGSVEPGKSLCLAVHGALQHANRLIIRLRANLLPGTPENTRIPVDLRFYVNGELLTGYRHEICIAPVAKTVSQVLGRLLGALRNVAAGFNSQDADDLAEKVKLILSAEIEAPSVYWHPKLRALADQFGVLSQNLAVQPNFIPERQRVQNHLNGLKDILAAPVNASTLSEFLEQIRELGDRIQEPAGRIARSK